MSLPFKRFPFLPTRPITRLKPGVNENLDFFWPQPETWLLRRNDQGVRGLLGHLEKIRGTPALYAFYDIAGAALVNTKTTVDPGQQRTATANFQQRAHKCFCSRMVFLVNRGALYGIGVRRLIFKRQANSSLVGKHVDVNSLLQGGGNYS